MPASLYRQAGVAELDGGNLQQQLPTVISHLHDYLIRVAAQLERQHAAVGRAKEGLMRSRPGLAGALEQVGAAPLAAGVLRAARVGRGVEGGVCGAAAPGPCLAACCRQVPGVHGSS
jgi:hypothetical protein